MMKNVFVDTGECNLVVLVIILLFKASKVTLTLTPPNSGIRIIYYEDDTMDHQNLKHRRDSKR
jgi:hypothetical protein